MDKFGIFKLLNSFYDLYGKKQGESQDETSAKITTATVKESPSSPPSYISSPLQSGMLDTIKNHDQFVKRVMEKNKNF